MNTIFAQGSASGKAGVCVFRISGPSSFASLRKLTQSNLDKIAARKMYVKKIYHPHSGKLIDIALIVYFSGNNSFTGEDSAEIYTHGSIAVIKMMHESLALLDDLRLAEPGEFAKRAFLNGKMDLTSAEGLADLIDAETELQQQQAIMQMSGALEQIYEKWRKQLVELISLIEAYIDFPDEDIPEETITKASILVKKIMDEITLHLDDNNRGERLRSGLKLAILGKPNVGKSSLLNHLMQREIAIVSNIAGTTRDVIEGHLDIGGYPIILQDTAGIRESTQDEIELEGINRAVKAASNADIKILVLDVSDTDQEKQILDNILDDKTILVINKIDLVEAEPMPKIYTSSPIFISIKDQIGLDKLTTAIIDMARSITPSPASAASITRARHRAELKKALEYLSDFSMNNDLVLAAEDLRMSIRTLSHLTGKITVDEILGEIFSNFCIGK
ncbi:MAG: tRNA uridine-5-carboxymethylaminomethyl(34) synthesis GTPase MnmE [Rickettsiales bacterium]|nr:tRNA uridine-5-carboxymethylaminomethyl(34) synthesis GTPase MnmE [Rickettsiales bacterium]